MNSRVKKFFSYYKPYTGLLVADLACALVIAGITLAFPLCVQFITKRLLEGNAVNALGQIYGVGGLMLALVAVHTACNIFVDYRGHGMGASMEGDLRRDLFAHYQTLPHSFYDDRQTGQLMTRITNDSFDISELYHHGPEDLLIAVLKFFGTFFILLNINLGLTLIVFLFLPVMAAYALYFNRRMNAANLNSKARVGDINAQVEDSLAGIRVVKSFTGEGAEIQKFARANRRFLESRGDGYRSEAWFSGGMTAFTQLMTVIVVVVGGAKIVDRSLELADLLTYVLYIGILTDPINRFVNLARLYQEGITGFQRVMDMLEIQPTITNASDATRIPRARGQLEFQHVSFKYRAGNPEVLHDVSLSIKAGEYLAIVGASGVGKTTLCSLIPRFYEVDRGTIQLDGHDLRTISLESLRGNIGIVQQDVYLFAGTVAENIRYGRRDATDEEIIAAARNANAHEFITALPNGYQTDIGQHGIKLSGGQKQRLSIARVFLKDPPIIIFDEATSALDSRSELEIQRSLERLSDNRTTLVIAHRLSTVRNAHRIVVLTESGIAEQGTHEELLRLGGRYAALHDTQLRI